MEDRDSIYTEIASVIGTEAADKLCGVWGGLEEYIPASVTEDHPLSEIIGLEAASALCKHFRVGATGIRIVLPMRRLHVAASIRTMLEEGKTARSIARQLRVHIRTVYRHRAKLRKKKRQARLLGTKKVAG